MDETFGYPPARWQDAKEEARRAMILTASHEQLMTYADLVEGIAAIHFQPHDFNLFHLLGQISTSEKNSGRGMLSAVVVTAEDQAPGQGFFKLAKELGIAFDDQTEFWATELKVVYTTWNK